MCVAIPVQVISVTLDKATVDTGAQQIVVGRLFVPDAQPGDWVLINTGQMVSRVSPEEVEALRELWKEIAAEPSLLQIEG